MILREKCKPSFKINRKTITLIASIFGAKSDRGLGNPHTDRDIPILAIVLTPKFNFLRKTPNDFEDVVLIISARKTGQSHCFYIL